MAANKAIKVNFFNSSLTDEEAKQAEFSGMVILASDFIKSSRVNKAEKLERITKLSVPIFLSKTKTGRYISLNPSASHSIKVPLMQLVTLGDLTAFVGDPKNLNLEKLYKMLLKFKAEEAELMGGYNAKELRVVEETLKAPRAERSDFPVIRPIGNADELRAQLQTINDLVYDDTSLDKAIKERIKIIEDALAEVSSDYANKYNERAAFWKTEIDNASINLKKRIKEREALLAKDIKNLQKESETKIKTETSNFFAGVAKNMRKDEVHLEKGIQRLEAIAKKGATEENVEEIKKILVKLKDDSTTFIADIEFQNSKIRILTSKKQDYLEILKLDEQGLVQKAEREKAIMVEESKHLEQNRDKELKKLKEDRDAAKQYLADFKDRKANWISDIREAIGGRGTPMINAEELRLTSPGKLVEVHIPMYVFQYRKNDNVHTIAIPPVKLPNSMNKPEKGSIFGDHKTVHFQPVVPALDSLVAQWFEGIAEEMDIANSIQALPNILDNSTQVRNNFFESNNLMINKLKVNQKRLSQANQRLTSVFSSG